VSAQQIYGKSKFTALEFHTSFLSQARGPEAGCREADGCAPMQGAAVRPIELGNGP